MMLSYHKNKKATQILSLFFKSEFQTNDIYFVILSISDNQFVSCVIRYDERYF